MAAGARLLGTAVALATAALVIVSFCFAGVAAALLSARLPTAVFEEPWLAVGVDLAVPLLARVVVFFAGADLFVAAVFFAVLVFFAAAFPAAFLTVSPCAAFLATADFAGAAFFLAAGFAAAPLLGAAVLAADFLAGAFCVTFFLASGDLLDAFFLLAAGFGAAFFAEDFLAALATTNPSSVRCEISFPQRIFR